MKPAFKWIGGASLAVAALFAVAGVAGYALTGAKSSPKLTAQDVLQIGPASPKTAAAQALAAPPAAPAAADEPFVIKRVLPIDGPIKYGEWHWNDAGVPNGPLVVTVDLDARVISVFKGGYEIGTAAVLLGTDDHPTPIGVFPIMSKERHNVSEKYDNAPMPWTLRLTPDGVAIHGGHLVENGYASHGCIGTPDGFAAKLFAIAHKGDKVIITRGKTTGVGQSLIG